MLLASLSSVSVSVAVTTCLRAKDVSGGERHTLVLMNNGTVWACGDNFYQQLGVEYDLEDQKVLRQVVGEDEDGYLTDITVAEAGWYHSLALDEDGYVWAWGTDSNYEGDFGILGNGPNMGDSSSPIKVHGEDNVGLLSNIVAISAGRSGRHSLAADSSGYAWAWGYNKYGQCGNDDEETNEQTPVKVLDSDPETTDVYLGDEVTIIAVEAGENHSLALDSNGHVWAWGRNDEYQLGIGDEAPSKSLIPVQVPSGEQNDPNNNPHTYLENIVAISAQEHSMALDKAQYSILTGGC